MRNRLFFLIAVTMVIFMVGCDGMGIIFDDTPAVVLEDTLLIVSSGGEPPRDVFVLGDIDLSIPSQIGPETADTTFTHWWLIGHIGADVVFSSSMDLSGTDLYSIEPYDGASPLDWNIAANLSSFAAGALYSPDWWATTVNNHQIHVAPDDGTAQLWRFNTTAHAIGNVTISIH